ncbi:unnamed protein product [Schistosoma rodhaini]|uniref:Ubiquitin-like domain-containing protein n=1 Tax=Schistosoma rodhaini TaxID=6188 RepID=A0AA85F1H2_9TREM|nr:unnamed protein product [Schistosoma rodhaini]
MFDVTVKTLDGRDSVFHIEDEAIKIEDFKKEIEQKLNIAAEQQRLIFQGRVLNNEQTLLECGIQGKVVHLVVRPPPTTREQSSSGTATADSTANMGGSGLGGFTFGGISMQQAIQDITSGILSGVSELSRATNLSLSRDGDLSGDSLHDHSLITLRENTFNKLHRQATRLTQKISQIPYKDSHNNKAKPSETDPSPSTSHSTNQRDVQKDDIVNACDNVNKTSRRESSPMLVDTDEFDKIPPGEIENLNNDEQPKAEEENNTETVDNSINSTPEPSLALLADMLSRYRQLWHSIEPQLDLWEEMLHNESKIVGTTSEVCSTVEDSSTLEEIGQTSQNIETTRRTTLSNWHPRLFSQVSRLLHLNAHMLHLISDFNVITMTERETQQVNSTVSTSQSSNSEPKTSTSDESQRQDTDANTLIDLTRDPAKEQKPVPQVKRCTQRVLSVSDTDRRRIRARISVEPPDLTIVATGDGQEPRIIRSEHSVSNTGSTTSRIRSRSASNVNRASNLQTENIPAVTSSSGTPNPAMTTTTTSLGNGRTAIIHRLPAAPFLASLSSPVTATNAPTSVVSIPSTTRTVTTSSDSLPTTHTNVTMVPRPSLPPLTVIDSVDPFLACNSRHFSREVGHRVSTSYSLPEPPPLTPINDVITTHGVNISRLGRSQATVEPASLNNQARSGLPSQVPSSFAECVPPSAPGNPPTVNTGSAGTRPPGSFSFGSGINLPQHLLSLVSAATNAAISAVSTDNFTPGPSPFNLLVSSSPIQFSMNPSHPVTNLAGSATSTTTTTTSGSTTHSSSRIFPQAKPSWVSNEINQSQLRGISQIFSVLIDGLIKTVWSRISRSSNLVVACEYVNDPNYSVNSASRGRSVSVGLLSDIITAIHNEVNEHPDTQSCGHITSSSLDGLREHLQHHLFWAESVLGNNQTELVNSLVNVIFRDRLSDASHSEYATWLRNFGENLPEHLVDITASFAKLCRYIISSQLDLWRASPTNTGFGNTLLMTLKIACTDLLCLTDILTNHLASSLGIELHTESSCSESSQGIRNQMFGITTGFDILLDHLNSFLQENEDDENFDFAQDFITGFENCIKSYCDMDETTLRAKVTHQKSSYIEFRKSQMPSPMMVDPSNGEIQRNVFDDEDLHGDDLPFLDAYSDLPSDEMNHPISAVPKNNVHTGRLKLQSKISSLPDWTPKPGELPNSMINGLDPNPNATLSISNDLSVPNETEGWHAVLPPAWIHVVTSDISAMSHNPPTTDDPNQFGRFSDGYIAGMPAKRRKVMQEHSASLFQSPDQLFIECLSDAVASDYVNKEKTNEHSNNDVEDKYKSNLRRLPAADIKLVNSLKDIVSDRLAVRLTNDPDFDTAQFPLSTQKFLRRDPKARM